MKALTNFTFLFCLMAVMFATYMQLGSNGFLLLVMSMAAQTVLFALYIENKER